MKNNMKVLALMAAMVMAVGCAGNKGPEQVVEQCWKALDKGNVEKAVEMINIAEDEKDTYVQLYADVCRSLNVAGGVEEFEVIGSSVGPQEATIEATVTLKSGQQITQTYELVVVGKEWKLKQ